jgi:hypothetical protein
VKGPDIDIFDDEQDWLDYLRLRAKAARTEDEDDDVPL